MIVSKLFEQEETLKIDCEKFTELFNKKLRSEGVDEVATFLFVGAGHLESTDGRYKFRAVWEDTIERQFCYNTMLCKKWCYR